MNKWLLLTTLLVAVYIAAGAGPDVYSSKFRRNRIRLPPTRRRFTLTKPIGGGRSPTLRRMPIRRRPASGSLVRTSGGPLRGLGPVSALRAGQEGSYDFSDQHNAIIPDKGYTKPKKEIPTENPNKINIESKISTDAEEENVITEVVHVGETAIVHCTFDDIEQIGAYRQAKIWWTKLSARNTDRPVIVAAGTQVRIPDDRLRVVTFPDNTFSILIIKDVLPEDSGQYKCSLPTVTGTETSFTKLVVKEAKSDLISMSTKETSLNAGEEMSLFCRPRDQSLKVWWTAKDSAGNNIDVTRGFDRVAGRNLIIRNIQGNQAGIYTCHVQIGFGVPVRRHFNVLVKERPWPIEAYIAGFQVNSLLAKYNKDPVYGDNVNLRCETGGVPTPAVQWYKDGRLLGSNTYKYTITAYEPSYKENSVISKLTVVSFQRYDEGRYECKAVNDAGSQDQSFDIRGIASDVNGVLPTDDEDIDRAAALRGRKGELKISICKAGMPCRRSGSSSKSAQTVREYSGDDE